jgi:hypothetical protein
VGKAQSPLLGFNNNVKHRGRVFHIQTEDSGIKYPHVITHLFADGGRILKSVKTSYAEYLGSEDLQETVRNLMKEQHKSMFIALRDGQFDDLIEEGSSEPSKRAPSQTQEASSTPTAPPATPAGEPPSREQISVDVDALERAAVSVQSRSPLFGGEDMPPPPPAVLPGRRPSGSYRAVGTESVDPGSDKATAGRYSATRPASIFGTSSPSESSSSVFGEDVISGKSLDEVILSFLAEEFGTPPDKDKDKGGGK